MRVIDFFSGCGGASCGFRNAGLEILAAVDNDVVAVNTFSENFPDAQAMHADITTLPTETFADLIDKNASPLLFAACAPCQPFSRQNRQKRGEDARANLLDEFTRFVVRYLPDYIFIENVPGLQKLPENASPLQRFLTTLVELKYTTPQVSVISAWSYGVPQPRPRLIIIASKHSLIHFPEPTHGKDLGLAEYTTVREWIGDLPHLSAGERNPEDFCHFALSLSSKNLQRIRATPEGGDRRNWDEVLHLDCHKRLDSIPGKTGHTDVYGRLAFDKPACSLTTKCISYSNGRFGHPKQDRAMSVREAACLQTFPRTFVFNCSPTVAARQIGNAVPPLLAEIFGKNFLNHSEKYKIQRSSS